MVPTTSAKRPSLIQLAQEQQFDNDIPQPNKYIQNLIKDNQSDGTADLNNPLPLNVRSGPPQPFPKFTHFDSKISYTSMKIRGTPADGIPSLTCINSTTLLQNGN